MNVAWSRSAGNVGAVTAMTAPGTTLSATGVS
jgi:hypothetical protein